MFLKCSWSTMILCTTQTFSKTAPSICTLVLVGCAIRLPYTIDFGECEAKAVYWGSDTTFNYRCTLIPVQYEEWISHPCFFIPVHFCTFGIRRERAVGTHLWHPTHGFCHFCKQTPAWQQPIFTGSEWQHRLSGVCSKKRRRGWFRYANRLLDTGESNSQWCGLSSIYLSVMHLALV